MPHVPAGSSVREVTEMEHALPSRGILGMIAALGRVGRPGRGGGGAARAPVAAVGGAASSLLELLHANMSVVLQTAAMHGGAADVVRGRAESDSLMVAEVADTFSMDRMAAEAEAEKKVRNEDGSISYDLVEPSETAAADVEAR